MKSNNDLLLEFYRDNPQIFFIRETNEFESDEKPAWLHTAITSPIELEDDPSKTMVDEPAFEYNQDETVVDKNPVFLTKSQLNTIKPKGKFSSALKPFTYSSSSIRYIQRAHQQFLQQLNLQIPYRQTKRPAKHRSLH